VSLFLLLASTLQCAQSPGGARGDDRLGVVRFPERFTKRGAGGGQRIITEVGYEVRTAPGPGGGNLLFGKKTFDLESRSVVYSDNFYAVSLDGRFRVTPAAAPDWERAARPDPAQRPKAIEAVSASADRLEHRGARFPKTGKTWGRPAALPSPGGRWVAVFSHTSKGDEPRPGPVVPGGSGYGKGEMFVDVYDAATGQKLLAGSAPHTGGGSPQILFESALWIGDRYLVVPLDNSGSEGETLFLGLMPE
jgi:hypothetical protein